MGIRVTVRSRWGESQAQDDPGSRRHLAVYSFEHGRVRIGRGRTADILLPHPAVSGLHASLEPSGAHYTITDEGSTNGVLVNGVRISPNRPKSLRDGDRVELGGFTLRLELTPTVSGATTANETAELARQLVRAVLSQGTTPVAAPLLVFENGSREGERVTLPDPPCSWRIGRGIECELQLNDADASREHAELLRDLDGVLLRDLGAKNPAMVNGRVYAERRLMDRDELRIGSTRMTFEDPASTVLARIQAEADLSVELEPDPFDSFDDELSGHDTPSDAATRGDSEGADAHEVDPSRGPVTPWEAAPVSDDSVAIADPKPRAPRRPRQSAALTDMVIYALAGAVLALSALGLWWLSAR
ncbi:MAG: FHA domain-containing protein [Sandaracinaceae bacterium]|nr:FHA domain-containing protein [Sandaracinaceae bacterium]